MRRERTRQRRTEWAITNENSLNISLCRTAFLETLEHLADDLLELPHFVVIKRPKFVLSAPLGEGPPFWRMNMSRFAARRSGISTVSMMRRSASSCLRR
jgi:hypothetical protein